MTLWTAPPTMKVAPGNAGAKGIGVFATAAIARGETISCDCTIPLSPADVRAVTPTVIDHYYFAHPEDDECGLLVLGLASLCNHADHPSALTVTARDPDLGWIVTLVAAHAIAAGEEITRRYACPVWFEPEAG
ncbi:MAG: SET domain-containing protein-lysine N-methyltransferase [Alphaproteobacteria bacterium]